MQIRRLHAQHAQCLLYLKGKPLKCIPQSRIFLLPGSSLCDKFVCQYANIKYCFRILEEHSNAKYLSSMSTSLSEALTEHRFGIFQCLLFDL